MLTTAEVDKRPFDQFGHDVHFNRVMTEGERISTCTLTALRLNDNSDVSLAFLSSLNATLPAGTATSGSTTTIINTAVDHASIGFRVGDWVVNHAKGWVAQIKEIRTTSSPNDTLLFSAQDVAAANGDGYSAQKAIAVIRAGSNAERVRVTYQATTNLGNKFQAEIIVHVRTP